MPDLLGYGEAVPSLRLTIDHLVNRLRLPAGIDDPGGARTRMGRALEHDVARYCGRVLSALPGDDEAVYRIRRLCVDVRVDLRAMAEDDVARRAGLALAQGIRHTMVRGTPDQVMRFESPPHFVAAFLRDLLDGRAWSRWVYDEFRHLRRLAPEQAALEILAARPAWIVPVLQALLPSGHTSRLIERWGASDVDRLWTALGFMGQPPLSLAGVEWVQAAWPAARSGGNDAAARARDRLRLWLDLVERHPAAAGDQGLAWLVAAWIDLAALLAIEPELGPLLAMETPLYPAACERIARGALADVLGWLAHVTSTEGGRATLARVARAVQRHSTPAARRTTLTSPVGCIFLLALGLDDLNLWPAWRVAWGEDGARRALFVVALKALGRQRAPLHLSEPALAWFAGLEAPPVADARLASEREPVDGTGQPLYPGDWAVDLPALAARWSPAHARCLGRGVAGDVEVLRDGQAGCWLAAGPVETEVGLSGLVGWPGLAALGPASPLDPAGQELLTTEVAHLQLGHRLGLAWLTPRLDATLSTVASLVMRRTAARLPRFAQASLPYLANTFLAQPATIRRGESLEVWLTGPLAAVLSLAPWPESMQLPWLEQPLCLAVATGLR